MTLRVLNTLSGEREEFEPADPDDVLLYYCGLTVSDSAHLGHARTWVHVDTIHRWLEHLGYGVRHVENITDVNEKITARVGERTDAGTLGDDEREVATRFTDRLLSDMRRLNLERAEVYPRVSEHVPEIIDLVETLLEKEYAYEADGSVYFDVTAFPDYGALSNQRLKDLEAQGPEAERAAKRNPADFALWKAGGVDPSALDHAEVDRPVDAGNFDPFACHPPAFGPPGDDAAFVAHPADHQRRCLTVFPPTPRPHRNTSQLGRPLLAVPRQQPQHPEVVEVIGIKRHGLPPRVALPGSTRARDRPAGFTPPGPR